MRINQILESDDPTYVAYNQSLKTIKRECSTFLHESQDLPVFRTLPSSYEDIQKVKVRQHHNKSRFVQTFNEAFEDQVQNLRQRAVFAVASPDKYEAKDEKDIFYVFPKNGYKFLYCTEVTHSNNDYQQVFDSLFEQFDDRAEQIIHDLLKFAYVDQNLFEGIKKQAEIINEYTSHEEVEGI